MKKEYGKNREKLEKLLSKDREMLGQVEKYRETFQANPSFLNKERNHYRVVINTNQSLQNTLATSANSVINLSTRKLFGWLGIPTKYDEMTYYSKWWKVYDNLITLSNILLILICFYDYELNFKYPRHIIAEYNHARTMMISISFVCIFCVIKRHYMKYQWRNSTIDRKYYQDDSTESNIEDLFFEEDRLTVGQGEVKMWKSGLWFDILINLILPYPRLDCHITFSELDRDSNTIQPVDYLLSDFIYIVVLLRSLYLVRAYMNYSVFSDIYAYQTCKEYKVINNSRFIMKCLLKTQHVKLILLSFASSVILFGFMLRIFDRPFWAAKGRIEFESYINPPWCVFVSMLTIGFGDYAPLTLLGKCVVFVATLWGVFIISFFIVCLTGLLDLSNDQFLVFTKVLKSRAAIQFIESSFKFHKYRFIVNKKNLYQTKANYQEMLENYIVFKNMRNESKSIYRSNGLLHYNMKLLNEMKKVYNRLGKIEYDIDTTRKRV